jgi:hypothetical protein
MRSNPARTHKNPAIACHRERNDESFETRWAPKAPKLNNRTKVRRVTAYVAFASTASTSESSALLASLRTTDNKYVFRDNATRDRITTMIVAVFGTNTLPEREYGISLTKNVNNEKNSINKCSHITFFKTRYLPASRP